jgi:RING finger protein 113A
MSSNTIDVPTADSAAPVVFFKRNNKGKSSFRKRVATPPPAAAATSDSNSDDYSSSEETPAGNARPIKKRKRNTGTITATSSSSSAPTRAQDHEVSAAHKFSAASRDIVSSTAAEATKRSNWYDKEEELLGRKRIPDTAGRGDEGGPGGGTYQGAAGYGSFIKKNENSLRKPVGPVKAPTNVRTITITDYAPDVCKDYKLTGFCGFGDTCKFLHAREDYAAGWKIDRDWEIKQKGGKLQDLPTKRTGSGWRGAGAEEKEEEDIPFKCVICKDDYKSPIQTKCGHYFCEKCAIERYRKNPGCAICERGTDGVFNGAKGLKKKLERKKELEDEEARKKKEEEEAEGK